LYIENQPDEWNKQEKNRKDGEEDR